MQFETDAYGFGLDSSFQSGGLDRVEPVSVPDDFSDASGVIRGDTWRLLRPKDRKASVDDAFSVIVDEAEKDLGKKVLFGGKETLLRNADGSWTNGGKEWLAAQRTVLASAADDESGGVEIDPYTGEVGLAPYLSPLLEKPKRQADPLAKFADIKKEVETEVLDGKPRELTWETFVQRANQGKDPDSPAALDGDNEELKRQFESRKRLEAFDPRSMGDKLFEVVEGVPVFNPDKMHKPSEIEAAIEASPLSAGDKKMALINLRDTYNRLDASIITQRSDALDSEMHKAPFLAVADMFVDRNTLNQRFADHLADPKNSMYSFIKENEAEFSDEKFGWADKLSSAFWNANRSTGAGALWLLSKPFGGSEAVTQFASDNAAMDERAFEGMGGTEHYKVLGMDFTNKGFYDMAGQVASLFATAGGGLVVKGGIKLLASLGARELAVAAAEGAASVAVKGSLAKGAVFAGEQLALSEAKILAATKALAPNTAKNLAIKALRDPSAYIGSLQASGMSFGSTYNEVLERTGDSAQALKQANIQAISDGLSAFVATSVFNRIAPGAEKMMTGVEGSMSGSILSRIKYAKASAASVSKKEALDLINDITKDETLRKALSKGLSETVDIGARAAGLKGFGIAGGMVSEFFEESVDQALGDVFSAMLDDSKTWTDDVWNNIGAKFGEYMAAGVMGAFGGGLGETVGGISSFSKKSRDQRAKDVKFYADRVWKNIKGNVESFDPVIHQTAAEAGVDKNIVSWAEYLANSPDSNDVKAKKFADEVMAGAYTADYADAPIDTPEAAVEAETPPSAPSSSDGAAAVSSATTDEGIAILEEAGISPPENKVFKSGLPVIRGDVIKVGKMGTMVPLMVGKASAPVLVEWTMSGGETKRISPEEAATILEENKGLFGFSKLGVNRAIKEYREAKSQYVENTDNAWTIEQSTASDDNRDEEPAPGKEGPRDRNASKADGDQSTTGNGGPVTPRRSDTGAPAATTLTPIQKAKQEVNDEVDEDKVIEWALSPLTGSPNFHRSSAIDRLKTEGKFDSGSAKIGRTDFEPQTGVAGIEATNASGRKVLITAEPAGNGTRWIFSDEDATTPGSYAGSIVMERPKARATAVRAIGLKNVLAIEGAHKKANSKIDSDTESAISEIEMVLSTLATAKKQQDEEQTDNQTNAENDGTQQENQRQGLQDEEVDPLEALVAELAAPEEAAGKPAPPKVLPEPKQTPGVKDMMRGFQRSDDGFLRMLVDQGRSEDDQAEQDRFDAARLILRNRLGYDPVTSAPLDAAAPSKVADQSPKAEIVTFTVRKEMALGGTDSLGGTWSHVPTSGKDGPETFYYTPPAGQTMRGNPSVLEVVDTKKNDGDESKQVLVLTGINNGRYQFKLIDLGRALENQTQGYEQKNFDRASRNWESTRLTASHKVVISQLSKLLGSGTVSQKDFNKVFNAVLKIVAPNVDPKDVVFTKLPGDSFIRTETREQVVVDTDKPIGGAPFKMENQPPVTFSTKAEERPVVVVDKDKMVGHFRYIFEGYRQGRGEFYDTMTANELARQLATWIDEEQIHRIALPLFKQEELQQFFEEALNAEGDAKSVKDILLETAKERLGPDFKTEEATPEQVRMLVHETLRKMLQLISTGSNSEMQTDSAKAVMALLNEEASKKGVFNKLKTVAAMFRRYFQRIKNALYMRRLHGKMTGHQQNMLNRLMSAYSKANLQGDVDMISQKAADHASWIYGSWKKDFEERTNKLVMQRDLSDALVALKGLSKRFVNNRLDTIVLLDPKTGRLSLSQQVKDLAEMGYLSAPIEKIEEALNTLNESNTGVDSMTQLVMARQALNAALFNVDDVRGMDVNNPTSTEVWNALEDGIRMSGDINALSAIQNFFADERVNIHDTLDQKLVEMDLSVIQEVRDADVNTREGFDKLLDIALKFGFSTDWTSDDYSRFEATSTGDGLVEWGGRFGLELGRSAKSPKDGWRMHLLVSLASKLYFNLVSGESSRGVLASVVDFLAVAKEISAAREKMTSVSERMEAAEAAYQESQNDTVWRKPLSEETREKYIRYIQFLQAVDEYNKAARNVVQRAIGEFDYRSEDHGLIFQDVTNPLSLPEPQYGFEDVAADNPSAVNGYRYVTAREAAKMSDEQKAELFGGAYRPSRNSAPELYAVVSSNAGHQGKISFERFNILQSLGVVPMSDTYTLTGGFNIDIERSENYGAKTKPPEEIFYRWKMDDSLAIHLQYVGSDGRNKTYPTKEKVIEAIGYEIDVDDDVSLESDPDLYFAAKNYADHLAYSKRWLDRMDKLVANGAIVEEIVGVQTLAGRQAVLLRRRLKEARAAFNLHANRVNGLFAKAFTEARNIGQEFDSLLSWENPETRVFREAMLNASADVMMARTAFRAFIDPQWRSNVRQEANRSTRDAGFKPNEQYLALRDRPIDLPTYINYSWFLNHLSQKNSQYFVSPVYGSDLLSDLEKANWSNDGFEVFRSSVNESFKKYRADKTPAGASIYEKADPEIASEISSRYLWMLGKTHEERIEAYAKSVEQSGSEFGVVMMTVGSYAVIDANGDVYTKRLETDASGNARYNIQTRTVPDDFVFAQNQRDADGRALMPPSMMETSPYEEEGTQARSLRKKDAPEMIRRRWFTKTALLVGMRLRSPKTREQGLADTLEAQQFFHDLSSLDQQSNVNDIVRRGIAGLFGLYEAKWMDGVDRPILERLVDEFASRYPIQRVDPIALLENMVTFKAEKEQALLDQARVKDPDLAMQALVTLVAEATAGGRNQDMRGVSARPKMDKGAYAEEEVLGQPYTQEVEETYEETVPDPEGPFGGETKTVKKTRKKEVITGRATPEGGFDELDKAYREKNSGRSLFDGDGRNPNEFVSEDEIAEITRQFRRDMMVTSGELPAFRASVLKQDGGEHPFSSSNRTVNLLLQSLPGDVVIYAPQRDVVINGQKVKACGIPGRNGGPTVLYVRPGAQIGRDEAAALIASALSIHAASNPAIEQAIKDFAKDGMEKIGVMRSVERIEKLVHQRAKLYHTLSKKIGDKVLGGQSVDQQLRDSMQLAIRDHMIRLARHAAYRGSLNEASLYDENGQQTINGSIIFISELMTNPKIKELYDYLTAEDGLTSIPDAGVSSTALVEILQAVEDVTRSEFSDQDNQAAQYENDGLEDSSLDYSEEDFAQEGDSEELFDDNLGLELQEAAEADPDVSDVMAQGLANLGKEAGEVELDPLAPAKAEQVGLVESKRRIDGLMRRVFRDKSIHLKPSKTLAMLIKESRDMGNTGLHRGDAEIISFFAKLLGEANQQLAPFEGREALDYRYNTRETRLKAMEAIAGDDAYGMAMASAVLPGTNAGGKFYVGNWATLLRPDGPSRSSLITTAMNTNRHHTMAAGILGETADVHEAMMDLLARREEEINDSRAPGRKKEDALSGYGQQDVFAPASDALLQQLGHVLPKVSGEVVDGRVLNRVRVAARERRRVIDEVFDRKREAQKRLEETTKEREALEKEKLAEDVDLSELILEDNEPLVKSIVDELVAELDDQINHRVLNRGNKARHVAGKFVHLSNNQFWKARRVEIQTEINGLDKDIRAWRRSDEKGGLPIEIKANASWLNKLIERFEGEVNESLEYILRAQYGVGLAPIENTKKPTSSQKVDSDWFLGSRSGRRKLFEMDRVDTVGYDNFGTLLSSVNSAFRPDSLAREIGDVMSLLERGELGDVFSDVLVGGTQSAEEKISKTDEKASRLAKGKATKPRKGDLTTNSQRQLNNLIRDLEERFAGNPDRTEARAYIRSIVERGFNQEMSLDLLSDIVQENKLLSSAVRALLPSKDVRYRMMVDTGKLSVDVRDRIEKLQQVELEAQREIERSDAEILRLVARSARTHEVGWTKRYTEKKNTADLAGQRPEMSFIIHLSPPGLEVSPSLTPVERNRKIREFSDKRVAEMLAQLERGETPDFSYIANVDAIMREVGHVARHELDDTYKLLKADSQYFNDFNPELLIRNVIEQAKAEKAMVEARIKQARDIANEVAPTGGLNSLGVDALTMLSDPANDVQIVSVSAPVEVFDNKIGQLETLLSEAKEDLEKAKKLRSPLRKDKKITRSALVKWLAGSKLSEEQKSAIASEFDSSSGDQFLVDKMSGIVTDIEGKLSKLRENRKAIAVRSRIKQRVSTWTAPANWQARRDLLGRLVNDEGQWVVLAPTTAREELAKRYADTGRPKVTFENFVLDALAPTLTGKDYEGNSVSRLNFSAAYLDEPTDLDLPILNGSKTTKGMSRREAAKAIEHKYRVRTLFRMQADSAKNGEKKIEDEGLVAEALDRFSYMVRAMVHAYDHKGLSSDVKVKLSDWLSRLQDMSSKGFFASLDAIQQMNTIDMFADVFADIEGGYIMDTLASGLAMDPQAHTLAMMKYLHHEDGRTRGRFIRSYVAMQEATRLRSLLDRGFDDTSGRIGAKVQHQRTTEAILKTQKALGDDALDQSKAYVHASLQGILDTRNNTVSWNLKRWIEDFNKGVYDLEELNKQQNKKFKNAGSRFFRAMHIDLIRDIELVREIQKTLQNEIDAFSKSNDLTFESSERMAKQLIETMQKKLASGEKESAIKAHSDTLTKVFGEMTDALQATKMLMSQPKTPTGEGDEFISLKNDSKDPRMFRRFVTTVPLRFHYASNPMESEVDKASFEEGRKIEDPIDIVKLEESALLGGIGRHENLNGRAPYRPINLNGLSAVDSLLEDTFYRLNVTPAYTVLRKVVGREEPNSKGITMISEDAKILRPINQTKDWKYVHRAKRVALAAVARELEGVIANDSQMGVHNTQFSEAIRFLSSVFTVKALFSVLQLWNQTAPASVLMAVKKLVIGDVQGAKDFVRIAARMGGSGTLARMKDLTQSEAEKNNSDAFFHKVDRWVKTVDPWISFRGTDGMDPYRNVLRNQKRYGVGAVKATIGKLTKQLEALGEKGMDTTIGVGERWIARSIYMTELLGELRRMNEAGVIDYAPENVDKLLEIPGKLIPTQAKDYARMKVNDMMGMADQSKKALPFQSHSRFPGIQALTRSAVRFSNHTATTASNMTALLPAIHRLGDSASYGEQRMRQEAVENVIGTLGQNTLFHLMKLHTLVPLVAYIIFNSTGDDDDEAQEKAQALADGMLAPSEEMDKMSDYLKAAVFGKENQLFQDWRDPESARRSAYANLLGKTMTEFAQAIPVAGVALGYMPVNAASKSLTDPIAEHLLAIGEDMEVVRGNMAEDGVRIYERERGPVEGLAQLTAPSAELYNLFDAGRTSVNSMFLDDSEPLTTAAYLLSEVFATRELRGALEGRLKKKIRDEE